MRGRACRVATLALGVCLATGVPAQAAKTDVVVMRNGDRVTCEVVELRRGKLKVKTDDLGTVSIEWDKIAAVATAERYDVTMRDGTRLFGRLATAPAGSVQVVTDGGVATTVPMADVVWMTAIKSSFLERIDGSVDLGGSYTKASGIAQFFVDAVATFRRPAYALGASFSSSLTRQPDSPDTSRYSGKLEYTRYRARNWFVSSLGLFEGNEDLGFTLRGTGALSLGRFIVRSNRVEFLLAGGLAAGREFPVEGDQVTNVDLVIATDLSVFSYDYPTTGLDVSLLVFPSLDDGGRVRVNVNAKYKQELFRDFYVSVSGYDAFDNRPKVAAADRNDVGGSLSFGWTF